MRRQGGSNLASIVRRRTSGLQWNFAASTGRQILQVCDLARDLAWLALDEVTLSETIHSLESLSFTCQCWARRL